MSRKICYPDLCQDYTYIFSKVRFHTTKYLDYTSSLLNCKNMIRQEYFTCYPARDYLRKHLPEDNERQVAMELKLMFRNETIRRGCTKNHGSLLDLKARLNLSRKCLKGCLLFSSDLREFVLIPFPSRTVSSLFPSALKEFVLPFSSVNPSCRFSFFSFFFFSLRPDGLGSLIKLVNDPGLCT